MKRLFFAALFTFVLAMPMAAMAGEYKFDPAHTRIVFGVSHLGFTNQIGEFREFDGGFTFDPENVMDSVVDVTIDTASIDIANHEKWNAHMRNEDFFHVEKFPTMTFKSTAIEVTGEKTGRLTGDLTILAVTKPVTLDVVWNKTGSNPFNKAIVSGFSADGKIKRSDFGMTYGLPGVGDEVSIHIEVEGIKQTPAAPNADK